MKRTLIFLFTIICLVQIYPEEYNITKTFIKMRKEIKTENNDNFPISLLFISNDSHKRYTEENITLNIYLKNGKVKTGRYKTNFTNEFLYEKEMMENIAKVTYTSQNGKKIIDKIILAGYNSDYQIYRFLNKFRIYIGKVKAKPYQVNLENYKMIDEGVYVDNTIDKIHPNYLEYKERIKQILNSEYGWLLRLDLKFIFSSAAIDNYLPLNYFYIHYSWFRDNPYSWYRDPKHIRIILHEILESQIIIYRNGWKGPYSRLINDGIVEIFVEDIINAISQKNYFNLIYGKYLKRKEEVHKFEKINFFNNLKADWIGSYERTKYYFAAQYFWEKLIYDTQSDLAKLRELLKKIGIKCTNSQKQVVEIIAETFGITEEEVYNRLNVYYEEMIDFYEKKYGFDDKYKDMVHIISRNIIVGHLPEVNCFIDKYEVSNKKYCVFLNEAGNQKEEGVFWYNGDDIFQDENGAWKVKEGMENIPVVNITYYGAEAYAKWAGKRLPTFFEWQVAAGQGSILSPVKRLSISNPTIEDIKRDEETIRLYPWGYEWGAKRCNWGDNGEYDGYVGLAPVDSFPNGKSDFGCYNMVGNAFEFVKKGENENFQRHVGGAFKYGKELNNNNSNVVGFLNDYYYTVGFRCVKDIEF